MRAGHGGETVEVRGDGFLLAFAPVQAAARGAIEMGRGLSSIEQSDSAEAISVRTDLHSGPAIADGGG